MMTIQENYWKKIIWNKLKIILEKTTFEEVDNLYQKQKAFFASHQTKNIHFRLEKLRMLKFAIEKYEPKIIEALWKDLRKSKEEAKLTEISIVTREIDHHIKNLKKWAAASGVSTPLFLRPSSGKVYTEPLGNAFIMAPWNYPFQLLLNPLVGAISSGCCAVLKPSRETANVSAVMKEMIRDCFNEEYIAVVNVDHEVGTHILNKPFDIIFFTGSTRMGKIVMKAAAEHLTPVVLELGGKSPCIVDEKANINIAAKRISWGKGINAGQTCIAPDYLLVHESVKDELLQKTASQFEEMYGTDIQKSGYYPRIVNQKSFDRLEDQLQKTKGKIICGGKTDRNALYIAPTILDGIEPGDVLMQEEIFGPLLPVMTYSNLEEAISYINSKPKPLALYYFGKKEKAEEVLKKTSSGGSCINDTLMHIGNHNLPFGGVGHSGQGRYHGKESFLAFSHLRAVVNSPTWIDFAFRYPPFKYFDVVRKMVL